MGAFFRRLLHLGRGSREVDALREELETHRQLRQAQLERDGMTTDDAAGISRRLLGNTLLAREDAQHVWSGWLAAAWVDLRHGLRALRAHWRFAAVSCLTLALCLGANVLVFTLVNALWLRPRPVVDPDHLVMITSPAGSGTSEGSFAESRLQSLRLQPVFSGVAGQVATSGYNSTYRPHIVIDGAAGSMEALAVTPQYFAVAGVPLLGRDFSLEDDQPGAAPVAIISDHFWSRTFARDSRVIGTTIPAAPVPLRIIGVAARDFHGVRLGERVDLWIPRALTQRVALGRLARGSLPLLVLARLSPGLSATAAHDAMYRDWREPAATQPVPRGLVGGAIGPPMTFDSTGQRVPLEFVPISRIFGSPTSRTLVIGEDRVLFVAMITAALVLLGGCATLMALVLVSYEQRRQELAVRLALGCSRSRLIGSLAVEQTCVLLTGTVAAMLLATWGLQALPALSLPGGLEIARLDLTPDWRVVAFGAFAALGTFGLAATAPLIRSTRPVLVTDLAVSSGRSTPSSYSVRRVLLAAQIAATIIVLVAANLFVLTVRDGFNRGPGFDTHRTLFVELQGRSMSASGDEESQAVIAALAQKLRSLVETLRAVPGVEMVAVGGAPLGLDQSVAAARSHEVRIGNERRLLAVARVFGGPEYLQALGAPILAGRGLTVADIRAGNDERPAVVTASLARALWPDGNAVGQRFAAGVQYEVVGVVSDIAQGSLRLDQRAAVFAASDIDYAAGRDAVALTLRVAGNPASFTSSVRDAIAHHFGTLPRVDIATGREIIARDLGRERLGAWFFSGFGIVALALGAAGVFGLVGHLVAARRREIGVRLALGATSQSVIGLTLSSALKPVTAGIFVGLSGAVILAASLEASLPGVRSLDLTTALAMPGLTFASAAVAGLVAAWRIRRISAIEALRAE
jgi:predicted permease